jgi:hypothetical protein
VTPAVHSVPLVDRYTDAMPDLQEAAADTVELRGKDSNLDYLIQRSADR